MRSRPAQHAMKMMRVVTYSCTCQNRHDAPYARVATEAEVASLVDAACVVAAPPPPPDPSTLGRGKRARTSYAGAAARPSPHAQGYARQAVAAAKPPATPRVLRRGTPHAAGAAPGACCHGGLAALGVVAGESRAAPAVPKGGPFTAISAAGPTAALAAHARGNAVQGAAAMRQAPPAPHAAELSGKSARVQTRSKALASIHEE